MRRGVPSDRPVTTLSFGLLPCQSDRHVHAVYDPADDYPKSVCGWNLIPDVWLEGPVLLCRRCLAVLPDNATLRPACNERRLAVSAGEIGPLVRFERWRAAVQCDRRIRRAVASEWCHG